MRLIGNIESPSDAKIFSEFLKKEKIENDLETFIGMDHQPHTRIWIQNEDQVPVATEWLKQFKDRPKDTFFTADPVIVPPTAINNASAPVPHRKISTPITFFITFLCIAIYFYGEWTSPKMPEKIPQNAAFAMAYAPQIMKDLLFDYPKQYEIADKITHLYSLDQISNITESSPAELKTLVQELNATPYWHGAYGEVIEEIHNPDYKNYSGKLFEKIREGQYWRLFTPALLHGNLLHILFNIMWLIVLGQQIERRLGGFKMIILIVLTGIISNTCEYLMNGPNFVGLSGVVCGMAGFIWIRQKKAPWEGYLLHSSTILFIAIFVFAMAAIQVISFFLEIFAGFSISPGIANTAHITGGIAGIMLGSLNFFKRKHHHLHTSKLQP